MPFSVGILKYVGVCGATATCVCVLYVCRSFSGESVLVAVQLRLFEFYSQNFVRQFAQFIRHKSVLVRIITVPTQ